VKMGKSQGPSLSESRRAFRLIGEVRDVGHDSELWHQRLMEGVRELLHAQTAAGGEWRFRRTGWPPRWWLQG
jgi:hypothetical protein